MSVTIYPIYSQVAGVGGINSIDFTNIPQNYTDLMIKVSVRARLNGYDSFGLRFNDIYNDISITTLNNDAASFTSGRSSYRAMGAVPGANLASQYFAQFTVYIPNYTSGFRKSGWTESSSENNSTAAYMGIRGWSCSQTAPIKRIGIDASTSGQGWAEGTVFTLYGIINSSNRPKATGGDITTDGTYFYHTYRNTGSSTFVPNQNITGAELLIVGGGGSGCTSTFYQGTGGGGAGGVLYASGQSLTVGTSYSVAVGAGGIAPVADNSDLSGRPGSNSSFGSNIAIGGGAGGGGDGGTGGSGGGGGSQPQVTNGGLGGTATSGQGNAGGKGWWNGSFGAGGGGAGAVGQAAASGLPGNGGAGTSSYSNWGFITGTGHNVSGTFWYAGGGAGGYQGSIINYFGGNGGGGTGGAGSNSTTPAPTSGLPNTGGGGGGAGANGASANYRGGEGGSGVVIVRYPIS